jgi:4-carboxymuconolactone decarboxylase
VAWSHTPGLLAGYGALEIASERSRRLDRKLKLLAELKASTVAGCEWCIDFGSMLSRGALGIASQEFSAGSFCAVPERGATTVGSGR